MIRNVYFDNIWHCLVFETSLRSGISEKIYVNGKEYNRQDMDNIVTINTSERNEYKLFLSVDYHKHYIVTHFENYNEIVKVTIDVDSKKYHGRSNKSLLRSLEDDDIVTFSWGMGLDIEHEKAVVIGINEDGKKIGLASLVEYGIEDGYKYARYAARNIGVDGFISSLYGYQDDTSKRNTDYNFNVKKAKWYIGECGDWTQEEVINANLRAYSDNRLRKIFRAVRAAKRSTR